MPGQYLPVAAGGGDNAAPGEAGLDWEIDSAGTGHWHVGKPPDRRSILAALNQGVDISRQVCRLFRVSDFDEFDLILVMDKHNLADIQALARNKFDRQKVRLLLGDRNVPDPYYDDDQFAPVYTLIEEGCKQIIKEYKQK